MDRCPECGNTLQDALVVCGHCGEILPLRVIVVSEGSQGEGFALVTEKQEARGKRQEAGGRKQEAGSRRQEAGGRRQEAGGRRRSMTNDK